MPIKTCEKCGNEFKVKWAKGPERFCGRECRLAVRSAHHAEKTCEQCAKTFTITRKREADRRFCGRACQNAHEATHGRPAAWAEETVFSCKTCGGQFTYKPAYLTEYRKKFGKDPLYCSRKCAGLGRQAENEIRQTFTCEHCGKVGTRTKFAAKGRTKYYSQQRFCGQECKVAHQVATAGARFEAGNIGRHVKRNGYVWISIPSAITGDKKREMLEHRWVMEQHLGRPLLPGETCHHRDGDRGNNTIENLELHASNHGPGQAVPDIMKWCVEMVQRYPVYAQAVGLMVVDVPHSETASATTTTVMPLASRSISMEK